MNASAIVVAGGQSRRLGHDKRHLRLWGEDGPTLLRHTVDIVAAVCDEVVVVLNDSEQWPDLPARLIRDAYPQSGALGGLASGLEAIRSRYALAVASDMPLLNPALLQAMLALPRDYDVLIALGNASERRQRNPCGAEPLHAIYSQDCLAPMQQQIAAGNYQIAGFLDMVRVRTLDSALIRAYDPQGYSFLNINTPQQLEQAQKLLEV